MKIVKYSCFAVLAAGLFSCQKDLQSPTVTSNAGQSAQTAQSIMIKGIADEDYIVNGGGAEVWHFDQQAAAEAQPGYAECTTNPCRQQIQQYVQQHKCDFWNTEGHPFWTKQEKGGGVDGSLDLPVNLQLAAVSWMANKTFPMPGKYSFTLTNSDGSSRISGLQYSVDGGTPMPITTPAVITSGADFDYEANAFVSATNGDKVNKSIKALGTGANKGYLLLDVPTNNDNANFAYQANTSFTVAGLSAGQHAITITGVLKDNTGIFTTAPFSVTKNVHISAEGCQ